MKPVELKVYEKGQVVLPLALRQRLRLIKGSRVRAFEYGGVIYLLPKRSLDEALAAATGFLPRRPSLAKELLKRRKKDFA